MEKDFDWCIKEANCCKTPELSINSSVVDECTTECESDPDMCCIRICILRRVNFLQFSTDPNVMPQINQNALLKLYMDSVDDDPAWEPIVRSSTNRCFDDMHGIVNNFTCGVIPDNVPLINFCCYKENFLKCPYLQKNQACDACVAFIKECIADMDSYYFTLLI